MKIHWAESQYDDRIAADFKRKYTHEIKAAFKEVSKLLPFGSPRINFFIQPRTYALIEETRDNARTLNAEFIELAFDPTCDAKGLKVILDGLRPGVYHEMNHAARFNIPIYHKTFLDNCVLEGLATVFTREYAGEDAPWGKYPKDVQKWLDELIEKNDMFYWQEYMFQHPDGRRWIGYKVGTYIVDEAAKRSGKTILELSKLEPKEILKLAQVV